ncbi:Ycf51 family protein [Cyanobacteria bacterium FACHB-63]|nr:Ycf51 family protein [Cyanobacteria bacterium FACHB-63]
MFETAQLIEKTQWLGIATIAFAVLTIVAFLFKWGIRFRLVGVTGFTAVLTGGVFALSLGLYNRPNIPGNVHYSRVFDAGAAQVVIAVPPTITESQLEATLKQAAIDIFSFGRLGQGSNQMTIRARTILHPEKGISQPLYLGEIQRSLAMREDENATIKLYRENLAQLPQPAA